MLLKHIISLIIVFTITGCGFHLRGNIKIPPEYATLRILPDNQYDKFQIGLINLLKGNNVTIAPSSQTKVATLHINSYSFATESIAKNIDGKTIRSRVKITVKYKVFRPDGSELQVYGTVNAARNVDVDPDALLTTDSEQETIKDEIINDAIGQLFRQLTAATK